MVDLPRKCELCEAVEMAQRGLVGHSLENTPLLTTDRFVVMPCIGPLFVGHVMVVSKAHFPSLAGMGGAAIDEYHRLAATVRGSSPTFAGGFLEAEHGAVEGDCGGACVVHAHVHWIPSVGSYADMFDGVLDVLGTELESLADTRLPYAFLRGDDKKIRLHDARGIPVQMVRHTICSIVGSSETDWCADRRDHRIRQTIDSWTVN